jgi:glycerol uptake facilitator protein
MYTLLPIGRKADSGWDYAFVPVIGPVVGAAAGLLVRSLGI